jgi:hypothetical protein
VKVDDGRIRNYARQLERMERDADGRALLGERYGLQFQTKQEATGPFVFILVPSYSEGTPKNFENALHAMVDYSRSKGVNVYQPLIFGHSLISWVRNELIAKVIKGNRPWDYVLFIDDDICPEPDALVKLLSHGKDITSALCTKRCDPPIPTIRSFDEATGDFRQVLQWKNHGELMQVDAVGTGMMLISKKAILDIGEYTMECRYERKLYGDCATHRFSRFATITGQRIEHFEKTGDALWFQLLPALSGKGEYGEDIAFCLKARECGIGVYVDTSVTPRHLGTYGFSFDDFLSYRDEEIAKQRGQILTTEANADLSELIESK